MIQKCSIMQVFEVFLLEPTSMHFIREISKRIDLAPTSVRNHLNFLAKEKMIVKKKSRPFDGYIANRENDKFLHDKRAYNLYSLYSLKEHIKEELFPKAVVVFGSYSKGEDVETSDIDILIISKAKKELNLSSFEKKLQRKINIMIIEDIKKLDKNIREKIINGIVLHGGIES